MAYVFDTRHQSLAERQAFWVETMRSNIVPVEIDTGRDPGVHAAMMVAEFGDLGLRRVVGGSHDYRRTKENISASDPETFQIAFPLKGSSVLVQDNREARLSPGQMVLYDTSRPFVLNMQENFEWEVFRLPKLMLRRSNRELSEITAIPIGHNTGMANVLSRFLNGISRQSQNLQKDHESFRLANTVNDLLGVMLDSYFSAGWQPEDQDEVVLQALFNLIQDHHRDPELNPQKIAGMQGISVRQVHRIFQQNGTTAMEQLKIVRLEATRRDLDEPAYSRRTVADIARSHGYRNAGVFTRNFKQAFGLSPRAYRQEKNAAQ